MELEGGLAAGLHSLRCWHVWQTGSVRGGETESAIVLGGLSAAAAAVARAQGEEVGGAPCRPWYPQAPS